ncbi:MAG: SDR family NAD(P)-dependent oxidoreductase [Alphaproteobacteria bacterium]
MRIKDATAVVTGASSGIGAAVAREFAARGARVALLARRQDELARVAGDISAKGGVAKTYGVDLTDAKAVAAVCRRVKDELGVPDIVVNNAGAGRWLFLDETSPDEAVAMMAAPYFASFFVTRAFLPEMLGRNSGHFVFVNSPACRITWPGAAAYTAARWAQRGLAEALRSDLFGTGLKVTHFIAGGVESPYWKVNPGSRERIPKIGRLIPVLSPEKTAAALARAVEGNKREVVVPFMMKMNFIQHALFPRVVEWLMRATGYRRPKRR